MYWLFTHNVLTPFKGYFDTECEAHIRLLDIIKDSEIYYKEILRKDANFEIHRNKLSEIDPKITVSYKAQNKFKNWTYFSGDDLDASIKLLSITDTYFTQDEIENIFTLNDRYVPLCLDDIEQLEKGVVSPLE